jgi:hypothetical protein
VRLTIVGVAAPGFVGIRTDSVADLWVPLTLQTPLGYAYNSSAYGSADRRKPWMDQDNIGWLNIIARVDRATQAEATTLLQNANARGLQRMADTFSDPRERSSTVARTLVVTSFARGFSDCGPDSPMRCSPSEPWSPSSARHVRQHLEPVAGSRDRTQPRDRHSHFAGRHDRTSGQAASGRESRAGSGWRRNERPRGVLDEHVLARSVFGRTGELPPVFTLDARVWIFTAVLSIGCAVAFGLAPALRAVAAGQTSGITINQRVSTYAAMKGMRPLVAAQLALSFAVVFAAVLLGRTLSYFASVDPGFNPDRLITAAIDPDTSGYSREQIPVMVDRLVAAIDAVPGVVSTSVTTCSLMTNCSYSSGFTIEGADRGIQLNNNWVSPAYFSTVGIPLVPAATSLSATRHRARASRSSASRSRAGISRIRTRSVNAWGMTRPTRRSSASSAMHARRCTPNRLRWSTSPPDNRPTSPPHRMPSPCVSRETRT